MGVQDVIAITVALGAVAFTLRFLWRTMAGKEGCSSCPSGSTKKVQIESPQLKRTPLVSVNPPPAKPQ